jgi:hypothetical protein
VNDNSIAKIKQKKSILNTSSILIAMGLSLSFHLLLAALFMQHCSIDLIEFWAFSLGDFFLWSLTLIPLIAIIQGRLAWFDPFSLLSVFFFGMIGAFYPAYLIDPEFLRVFSDYGGYILQYRSEPEFLFLVIKAELILSTFWTFMLVINRQQLDFTPPKFAKVEYRVAIWTTAFCLIGGIVGFFCYWNFDSFLKTITTSLGKPASAVEWGTARYLILVYIATISVSLGLVGWLNIVVKRSKLFTNGLVLLTALVVALVNMWDGSRTDVLLAFITLFMIVSLFGFRINRGTWLITGIITIIFLGLMTTIRGNPYLAGTPCDVVSQILSGEARQSYLKMVGSDVATFLGLDRVSVVTMVLGYLETGDGYLYGQSLTAGPINLVADWISRISGAGALHTGILKMASQVITLWRLGLQSAFGGVPPSIPGEFYMQMGVFPFFILSFLFSKIFLGLRRKVVTSKSVIGRWGYFIVSITMAKLVGCEISPFFGTFIYYILPVIIIYWFMILMRKILFTI